MNVIIYTGPGAVSPSATHSLAALRRILFPHYAVTTLGTEALLHQPWSSSCPLLVFSEGYESEYTAALGPNGRAEIVEYVEKGGKLLAIGDGVAAACGGEGNLELYQGGWMRESQDRKARSWVAVNAEGKLFYLMKAGEFVETEDSDRNSTKIIGTFVEQDNIVSEGGREKIAVLKSRFGDGAIVLVGVGLSPMINDHASDNSIQALTAKLEAAKLNMAESEELLRVCIRNLGLKLNQGEADDLQLSAIHISSITPSNAQKLKESWHDLIISKNEAEYIFDKKDTFRIETVTTGRSVAGKDKGQESLPVVNPLRENEFSLLIHSQDHPTLRETPYFDHNEFYSRIKQRRSLFSHSLDSFGSYLMYGQVMTSTNTILESNQKLLHRLPTGFTVLATRQTHGRGRSSNVWLSPAGCLLFSVCVRHPVSLMRQAHPLFIQYIASMAVAEAVKSYGEGYDSIPVRLKWPNDIYVEDPAMLGQEKFLKIGGILVQCSGDGKEYYLVAGIGFNVTNAAPTTSINHVLEAVNRRRNAEGQESLKSYTQESLLAGILVAFEELHTRFCSNGWDKYLEDLYHKRWLHSQQIVTLEAIEGAPRARIHGITSDWAYLRAEEIDDEDRGTGKIHDLQPNGNSFDFWKGLVKRKV